MYNENAGKQKPETSESPRELCLKVLSFSPGFSQV